MAGSDDMRDEDPEAEKIAEEFERHRDDLHDIILSYMDEEELDEAYVAELMIDMTVRMRMIAYGFSVEKPSAGGLKLELDRLQADMGEVLREAKKGAEEFVGYIKQVRDKIDATREENDAGEPE